MADDLISRQAAIDEIEYELEMINSVINSALDSMTLDFNARERLRQRKGEARKILNSIQQLPSAQQWIPCNKKLPKEEEEYLITCEDQYGDTFVKKTMYSPDSELWWGVPSSETVTAWMPTPKPYEVEE